MVVRRMAIVGMRERVRSHHQEGADKRKGTQEIPQKLQPQAVEKNVQEVR